MVPSGTWRTKDGKYVVVGGNGDSIYSRLMAAVGRQDMAADNPDYADNSRRCEREGEINEVRAPALHLTMLFTSCATAVKRLLLWTCAQLPCYIAR